MNDINVPLIRKSLQYLSVSGKRGIKMAQKNLKLSKRVIPFSLEQSEYEEKRQSESTGF